MQPVVQGNEDATRARRRVVALDELGSVLGEDRDPIAAVGDPGEARRDGPHAVVELGERGDAGIGHERDLVGRVATRVDEHVVELHRRRQRSERSIASATAARATRWSPIEPRPEPIVLIERCVAPALRHRST